MGKAEAKAMEEALQIGESKALEARQELEEFKRTTAAREQVLAQYHQVVGQVRTANMLREFLQVSRLVWIQQVRDSKIYKEFGTWETFCESIGYTRQHIEDQLRNLAAFGEKFTQTVCDLGVGYRDLRKLRQLTHDGTITIDAEAVVIGEERIPLTPEHKEDLQTAIEQIIEEQARVKEELDAQKKAFDRVQTDTRKSMVKLQKDLDKFTREAEAKGLTPDEDAFLQLVENWKISFDGYLMRLDPSFEATFADYERVTPRMCAALISGLHYMKMQILVAYDTAVTTHGDPAMNPELLEDFERWQQAQNQ